MSVGVSSSHRLCNMADVHSCRPWRPFGLLNCARSLALLALFMSSLVLTARVTDAQEVSGSGLRSLINLRGSPRLARVANGMIQISNDDDGDSKAEGERGGNPEVSNSAERVVRRISHLMELESHLGANEERNPLNTNANTPEEREGREHSVDLSSQEEAADAQPRTKKGFSVFSRLFPYFGSSNRKVSGLQQRSITSDDYLENQPQTRRSSSRPFRPRLRWG